MSSDRSLAQPWVQFLTVPVSQHLYRFVRHERLFLPRDRGDVGVGFSHKHATLRRIHTYCIPSNRVSHHRVKKRML